MANDKTTASVPEPDPPALRMSAIEMAGYVADAIQAAANGTVAGYGLEDPLGAPLDVCEANGEVVMIALADGSRFDILIRERHN